MLRLKNSIPARDDATVNLFSGFPKIDRGSGPQSVGLSQADPPAADKTALRFAARGSVGLAWSVFICAAIGLLCAASAGLLQTVDVEAACCGVLVAVECRRHPWVAPAIGALLLALAVFALLSLPFRGTHRWINVGSDLHVGIVLPLLAVTLVAVAQLQSKWNRRGIALAGFVCLILLQAYLAAGLLGTAVLFSVRFDRIRTLVIFALLAAGLTAVVLASPNRRERLAQFADGTAYHSKQVKRTVSQLSLLSAARGPHVHLPAAQTDLAPLFVARRFGFALSLAYILSVTVVGIFALRQGASGRPAGILLLLVSGLQLGISTGFLPVMGVPAPFLGAGATQWFAFSFLLAWLTLVSGSRDEKPH
jgi:cell division protein FtsW (lipid II flippase)